MSFPPLTKPLLPTLPRRARGEGEWSARTRRMWNGWRADWATQAFGPSEIAMAIEAIFLFEEMIRDPKPPRCAEVRQWVDRLGLNLKGKRDLRLRLGEPKRDDGRPKTGARLSALRLVGDAVPS